MACQMLSDSLNYRHGFWAGTTFNISFQSSSYYFPLNKMKSSVCLSSRGERFSCFSSNEKKSVNAVEHGAHKYGRQAKHTVFLWDSLQRTQAIPHHMDSTLRDAKQKTRGIYKYTIALYVRNQILMSRNHFVHGKLPKYWQFKNLFLTLNLWSLRH